jgi:hypothetical protein
MKSEVLSMSMFRSVLVSVAALTAPLIASTAPPQEAAAFQHTSHGGGQPPSALVDRVRQATRPFLDVRRATSAEYEQFLGCVSGPQEGAMGVHFVNSALVDDGVLDVDYPEALIYEAKDGRLRLVGVEFIVMADAWHANNAKPPVLGGQLFHLNPSPNRYGLGAFYELHVWAWRDNPNGAFVDWNPRVSCEGV